MTNIPLNINFDTDVHQFNRRLLSWYALYKRQLPWRETTDPYAIWISEIMLQQTQVDTVKPYFINFMQAFPCVSDLADANLEDIYKIWQGLGYYRRAKHLKEAAMQIMSTYHGRFPDTYEELLTLKGIGSYTASAISSIAFQIPKGVVDGNILRILSRIFNYQDNIAKESTKKKYQIIMDEIISQKDPSSFNQGMMDLGATICTFRNPDCSHCPLNTLCMAYKCGTVTLLPVNIKNKSKADLYYITGILKKGQEYFFIKNKSGLLENLYGLVQYEVESPLGFEDAFFEEYGLNVHLHTYVKEIRHVFTHRVWHMHVYIGEILDELPNDSDRYYLTKVPDTLPIPTAHLKCLNCVKDLL